jgi:hypothetical protein
MKQAEPSDYEFQQLVAEAVHRVGKSAVERYLSAAARDFGWPIRRSTVLMSALS